MTTYLTRATGDRQGLTLIAKVDLFDRPDPVRPARRFVAEQLRAWAVAGPMVDVAVLLTSEVVTNALLHAPHPGELELRLTGSRLRVSICDPIRRPPVLRPVDEESERGRGVLMLDLLAARWGIDRRGAGKVVWFEIDPPDAS